MAENFESCPRLKDLNQRCCVREHLFEVISALNGDTLHIKSPQGIKEIPITEACQTKLIDQSWLLL